MSIVTDVPLGYLRKLISEVRMREHSKESWQSWYSRVGTGQSVLQASTEIIFCVSDKAVDTFRGCFRCMGQIGRRKRCFRHDLMIFGIASLKILCLLHPFGKFLMGMVRHLIDCVGSILLESSLQHPDR